MTDVEIRLMLCDLIELALPAYEVAGDMPDAREPLAMLRVLGPLSWDQCDRAWALAFRCNHDAYMRLGPRSPERLVAWALSALTGLWPEFGHALSILRDAGEPPALSRGDAGDLVAAIMAGDDSAWGPLADALEEAGIDLPSRRPRDYSESVLNRDNPTVR
jgi:hypothetical protein